jgi:hypothetical protein
VLNQPDERFPFDRVGDVLAEPQRGKLAALQGLAEAGPRRLWDELAAAAHGWHAAGRPRPEQHELRVTADGEHTVTVRTARGDYQWRLE